MRSRSRRRTSTTVLGLALVGVLVAGALPPLQPVVAVTNSDGSVRVTKQVDGDAPGVDFGFTIDCDDGFADSFRLRDGESFTFTRPSDPYNECTVTETDRGGADETTWGLVLPDGSTVGDDADNPPAVTIVAGITRQLTYINVFSRSEPPDSDFADVADDHPFATEIAWLADTGITTGWPDNTFRPTNRVTRQAMAAFLYRFDAAIENRVAFTGLILDEDTGLPISGAPLLCISSEVWTAESDEEGRYACTGLPEGGYVLVLYVDGYQPRSFGPFLYDGAEPVEVDLPLVPMTVHPDVIGTVTDAVSGAVVAGAEIAVFWEDGGERWPSVPSDEEGAYSLRRVDRDREFRLRVAGPWQFEPWIGWEHPDIHVTDIYVYDGGEPLVIDIAITAP